MPVGRAVARVLAGAWRTTPPAPPTAADLRSAARVLLHTGAGGLAWWRVRGTPLATTSAGVRLHHAYRFVAAQEPLRAAQVADGVARCRAAGLDVVLGKGWSIARQYPGPGLRPYGDADLYTVGAAPPEACAAVARSCAFVDLHRGLAELDDRDEAEVRRRSVEIALHGRSVRVFSAEDQLRLLALHMMRHGVLRPLWLCDVALAVETRPPGFDWDWFLAGDRRRTAWAVAALRLSAELLEARLEGVPGALSDGPVPRRMVDAVVRQWGSATVPHGSRTPMAVEMHHPRGLVHALRMRWPNAIEAAFSLGGPAGDWPALPLQVTASVARATRFVLSRARPAPR